MSQIFFIVQGMVFFNGLDMVRMKEDKFECLDRKEGLHADIHSGCKVNKYMRPSTSNNNLDSNYKINDLSTCLSYKKWMFDDIQNKLFPYDYHFLSNRIIFNLRIQMINSCVRFSEILYVPWKREVRTLHLSSWDSF